MQTKLKICGLFRDEDIEFINEFTPDFAGFVFAPSKRRVTPEAARELIKKLSEKIIPVGVFVNETLDNILKITSLTNIQMIQLHGSENDAFIKELKKRCTLPIIKAVAPKKDIPENADYLLFDGDTPGSGKTFDRRTLPQTEKPWFLAGGINTDNIKEALALSPFCIDVSSGAETDGVKDRTKIAKLTALIKSGG